MKSNFDGAFSHVIQSEGGYANDPLDPGGETNLGVTKRAWEEYIGQQADEAEMRSLTAEIVKPFYKAKYWDKIKGDDLPSGVDYAAYDLAVNSGPARAAKYLQQIAGVPVDGVIGPKTLAAIKEAPADEVVDALCGMRMDFLKALPTFDVFGKGWTRRVAEVEEKAKGMA